MARAIPAHHHKSDRRDCRRENLRVVTIGEARQHHRVRRDSQTGIKGVRYHPETDLWSAVVYRGGRGRSLGTYPSREQAAAAYEAALRRENPDLHTAPERVDLPSDPEPAQPANRAGGCAGEGR